MLGWFKKTFSTKEEPVAPIEEQVPDLKVEEKPSVPDSPPDTTVETIEPEIPHQESEPDTMFQRLSKRLSKTKESLVYRIDTLFLGRKEIDADRSIWCSSV